MFGGMIVFGTIKAVSGETGIAFEPGNGVGGKPGGCEGCAGISGSSCGECISSSGSSFGLGGD